MCRELSDFDPETVKNYRWWFESGYPATRGLAYRMRRFSRRSAPSEDCADHRLHPTGEGLLKFGREYRIRQEYPAYFLAYRDCDSPDEQWVDRLESASGDWSGNVFDFFVQVSRKLVRMMKTPFKLIGAVRVDWDSTHGAVQEALVNCLVNADYTSPGGVVVESGIYNIALQNPGTIPVGREQMLRGGVSKPRNAGLLQLFHWIGYGKGLGSGVPSLFKAWKNAGY